MDAGKSSHAGSNCATATLTVGEGLLNMMKNDSVPKLSSREWHAYYAVN
jgi:hypothetical protein